MWLAFPERYDFNERVITAKPIGVNLDWRVDAEEKAYRLKVEISASSHSGRS